MPQGFANTPDPPYWAVIFTSKRTADDRGYAVMSKAMMERALAHPGCLGAESARNAEGLGITVAYYVDEASIVTWRADGPHQAAQKLGIECWYEHYELRIAKVERASTGPEERG